MQWGLLYRNSGFLGVTLKEGLPIAAQARHPAKKGEDKDDGK
jgi:hypothetical protein